MKKLTPILLIGLCIAIMTDPNNPKAAANYDESKVPNYELPDPLVCEDGTQVTDKKTWFQKRRPEILRLFETHVYGKSPAAPTTVPFDDLGTEEALNGKVLRKQVTIYPTGQKGELPVDVLIYLPKNTTQPVPCFLGLNFKGNHTIENDPGIKLNPRWMRNSSESGVENNKATEKSRGVAASRWPVQTIINNGYALATVYYGDIDPDFDDGFQNGIHPHYYKNNQTKPEPDQWGSIAAWAFGLSRVMDYFEKDINIDARNVAVIGHSRLGKTSLWAGAQDERFAMVISNDSGCGGAALSRRQFGETVKRINTSFPHWFCDNFTNYNDNVNDLPVDQHMLVALIAPRPVYIASAKEDRWADPRGEFLSARHADPVYQVLGQEGLPTQTMPDTDQPVHGDISYHIRAGGHDLTDYDWNQYIQVADQYLK